MLLSPSFQVKTPPFVSWRLLARTDWYSRAVFSFPKGLGFISFSVKYSVPLYFFLCRIHLTNVGECRVYDEDLGFVRAR